MYIKKINIDEFGKFTDFSLELGSGLNIIEGDNETGKSTVGMFIKFMFYGLSTAERQKYVGWGKNCCRGSLVVVSAGKEYKIERSLLLLAKGVKESVAIIDENLTPVFSDMTPDKVFLGVSERVFVSSAYVGAVSGTHIDGEKLTDAVENLLFSADETMNTAKALKKLDEARASLLHKNGKGGELFELEKSIAECEIKLAQAQSVNGDIFKTEERVNADRQKRKENAEGAELIRAKLEEYGAYLSISRLSKCNEQQQKATLAHQAYEEKRAALTVNERLPNGEYTRRLRTLGAELASVKNELAESETLLSGAESSLALKQESVNILDRIEQCGGDVEITSVLEENLGKSKSGLILSVVFAVIALLAIAGGVVLCVLDLLLYGIICFGVGIISAVICVIGAVNRGKALGKIDELVELFDCESGEELGELIALVQAEELLILKKRNDIEHAGERCQVLREKLSEKIRAVEELTSAYIPIEADESLLNGEADRIDGELVALTELKAEYEMQNALYEQLRLQTENVSIEKEKAKIKGILKTAEISEFNEDEQKRRLAFLDQSMASLDQRILENEKKLSALTSSVQNPAGLADLLADMKAKYKADKFTHAALELAYEKLQCASTSLRGSICPKLSSEASMYMKIISDGKYESLGIDESYSITAEGEGMTRSIGVFSTGTADIAYISLRLALINTLYRNGTPFVMFDDSFAHLDRDRLKSMLTLLSIKGDDGMQSIVFTCDNRESDICTSNLRSNIIRMKKA